MKTIKYAVKIKGIGTVARFDTLNEARQEVKYYKARDKAILGYCSKGTYKIVAE